MKPTTALAAVVLAALPLTACAAHLTQPTGSGGAIGSGTKAKAAATGRALPAVPDTEAAARSAAVNFLALYSAGQWQAAWADLAPADQRLVPEGLYVAFHDGCPSEVAGAAYEITHVTLAGKVAVISYTIPILSGFGSVTDSMVLVPGGWRYEIGAGNLANYRHGSLKADLKAAKAAGDCAKS